MYSPQVLFGQCGGTVDLLAHESFLTRARTERIQDNDCAARQALGAYLVARLIDRLLELDDSDEAAQSFAWQIEGCRRFTSDLPADDPEVSHLRGIVDAVSADAVGRTSVARVTVNAYAYFLEQAGRWEDALDIFALAGRMWGTAIPERELPELALSTARLNCLLARWERASYAYHTAEMSAKALGDVQLEMRARLGLATVACGEGNLPLARATVERVIAETTDPRLSDIQAMAHADLGTVLTRQGQPANAIRAMYHGFLRVQDPAQRTALLGDLGIGLAAAGAYDAARHALEMVVESSTLFQYTINARIELMDVESLVNNRVAFERHRTAARAVLERMPPGMAVGFRYKSGIGLARFGQLDRATVLWQEALALAEAHQLNEWYFTIDRTLQDAQAPARQALAFSNEQDAMSFATMSAEIGARLREARERGGTHDELLDFLPHF